MTAHGARHLLLASRSGAGAAGAEDLAGELRSLGASGEIAACDVADRDSVAALLASIPDERPLTAVIHAAGALDDGVIESLSAEQLERVLRPKADAAWHLHTLTEQADLAAFVVFSSVAGTIGTSGQGNYAAANAVLDGLAQQRRTRGLRATSVAWGLWDSPGGMAGGLGEQDVGRMGRTGVTALPAEEGLRLFDVALAHDSALMVAARLDDSALREQNGALPAVLRDLVAPRRGQDAPATAPPASAALREQLSARSPDEQQRVLLELVRSHSAAVLGRGSTSSVPTRQAFKELGFDSLTAIELRNRLGAATGVRLSATLVFDYPTPELLAEHLRGEMRPATAAVADEVASPHDELDEIAAALSALAADDELRASVTARLRALLARWSDAEPLTLAEQLEAATPDALFDFIDHELGVSAR